MPRFTVPHVALLNDLPSTAVQQFYLNKTSIHILCLIYKLHNALCLIEYFMVDFGTPRQAAVIAENPFKRLPLSQNDELKGF